MKTVRWYSFFLILCFATGSSKASEPVQNAASFRYLSRKDGLSQASVFAIAQDDSGFMWFGTRDGLNQYDGYHFKVYKNENKSNSLTNNDIRALYFDPKYQNLWVGTLAGLSKYRAQSDDFYSYRHSPTDETSISSEVIRTIFRDSKGRLWIGTAAGLNLYDADKDAFTRFYPNSTTGETLLANDVKAILEDADHQLWLGTAAGLFRLEETTGKGYTFEKMELEADTHIKAMLTDELGNFWIGTNNEGIHYWDRKQQSLTVFQHQETQATSLSHNNIRTLCLDQAGNLWVGTFDGLNVLEKSKNGFKKYKKTDSRSVGLSDGSIRSIFIDKRGSLWVGTYYGGINHLDENYNRFTNFSRSSNANSLSGDVVSSFAEDEKGNLWIGTEGGGLDFYDLKTKQFKYYKPQPGNENALSGNNVKQLLLDGDQLWIGTFNQGLNLLDINTEQFQHFTNDPQNGNSLSNNNVYGLHREGEKLWILTYGGGLDILDITNNRFYNYQSDANNPNALSSDLTRVFLQTKDGNLWIGTEKGINKVFKNKEGFPEKFTVFFADEIVYSLKEDFQQNIWIGTLSNGLYCFNPQNGQSTHFTIQDGLAGNTVFGILEDDRQQLWLSTNNGISKLDPVQKKFTNYNYSDGLENSEYNFNAYYKTRSGDLLFGGISGFTRFNPNTIQPNLFIPPVVFTALRQNNRVVEINDETASLQQAINETKRLTFQYNEANFSLSFAALDYFSPNNNHYAFMMEGLDRNWNYSVGATEATYTIQREGTYIFRLRGANSDGLWNPEERRLEIIVLPPPWRTIWAYCLYAFILGAAIFGLYRFIHLRHILQLQEVAKQQQEELHEVKLRFFTNITHEFRTPLTLILAPLKDLIHKGGHSAEVDQQLSLIELNVQRLLNLVNQVLTFRKLATDHEPMQIAQNNLVLFLQEIFLPFQKTAELRNIDYRFQSDQSEMLAWYDSDKLEKVFFNLLSNAFKFTPDGGLIEMQIAQKEKYIEVRVKDSGVGISADLHQQVFMRFYEKSNPKQSTIKGSGIGLAISKQLIELHHGEIFVATEQTGETGATLVVRIPTGKAHFRIEEIQQDFQNPELIAAYPPLAKTEIVSNPISSNPTPIQYTEEDTASKIPLLLIVEDNVEVRTYIQKIFTPDYRIITAENGVEGLKQIKKYNPDLIISDVMMPEMDGITMCEKLKSDLEISHIPIILLTARTAALFKIEGLKTGADDYITKPFDPEELRLRVRNIIQSRQEAHHKFARVLTFDPKEITITSADEVFLENAMRIVEKNIDNQDFNALQFASELAVSRPLLFTKIKALTNQTPNNFIKTIRLKRAAQLLRQQKLNISEVAYKVGFRDPKYFRKCFQQQFEVTPSEFIENQEES